MHSPRVLRIGERELKSLVRKALSTPIEVCGLLLGRERGEVVEVVEVMEASNLASSPYLFEVNPEDVYRALKEAEKRGVDLVGIYHSHPAAPNPSSKDQEGMRRWPMTWLIISSLDGSVKAYRLSEEGLEEVKVEEV